MPTRIGYDPVGYAWRDGMERSTVGARNGWSWTIGEWPNILILFACLGGTLLYAKLAGRSPLECFGDRANGRLVRTVRHEHVPRGPNSTLMRWLIWG